MTSKTVAVTMAAVFAAAGALAQNAEAVGAYGAYGTGYQKTPNTPAVAQPEQDTPEPDHRAPQPPELDAGHVHAHYQMNGYDVVEYTPMISDRLHVQISDAHMVADTAVALDEDSVVIDSKNDKPPTMKSYRLGGATKTEFMLRSVAAPCVLSENGRFSAVLTCDAPKAAVQAPAPKK